MILLAFCISSPLCALAVDSAPVEVTAVTQKVLPEEKKVPVAEPPLEDQKRYKELRKQSAENTSLLSPAKVFSNLIVLILLLLALAWAYKKYGKDVLSKVAAVRPVNKYSINVLSSASVGQGKYLHVVEVGGDKILIGATANNISFLKDIKTEKAVSDEKNDTNWQ